MSRSYSKNQWKIINVGLEADNRHEYTTEIPEIPRKLLIVVWFWNTDDLLKALKIQTINDEMVTNKQH